MLIHGENKPKLEEKIKVAYIFWERSISHQIYVGIAIALELNDFRFQGLKSCANAFFTASTSIFGFNITFRFV